MADAGGAVGTHAQQTLDRIMTTSDKGSLHMTLDGGTRLEPPPASQPTEAFEPRQDLSSMGYPTIPDQDTWAGDEMSEHTFRCSVRNQQRQWDSAGQLWAARRRKGAHEATLDATIDEYPEVEL